MNDPIGAAETSETNDIAGDSVPDRTATPNAAFTIELGRRIKRLRIERGLTLKDLEARGGISATHVSEIERGKASPTVGALGRIAVALGVRPALLVPGTGLPEIQVVRAAEREATALKRGTLVVAPLTGPTHGARLGAHRMTLAPSDGPALTHRHEGEECVTVLSGTIEIRVGEESWVLHEGDALHFRAHLSHSYANAGPLPAVIVAASQPRFLH